MASHALQRRFWHEILAWTYRKLISHGYGFAMAESVVVLILILIFHPLPPSKEDTSVAGICSSFLTEPLKTSFTFPPNILACSVKQSGIISKPFISPIKSLVLSPDSAIGIAQEFIDESPNLIMHRKCFPSNGRTSHDFPSKVSKTELSRNKASKHNPPIWFGAFNGRFLTEFDSTSKDATAYTDEIGRFSGFACQASIAVMPASAISTKIPIISKIQPHSPSILCGLYGGAKNFSFIQSEIFSIDKPIKTDIPPATAQNNAQNSPSSDDDVARLISFWRICMLILAGTGIFCAGLVIFCRRH
jgi:hypothetical protein